ncbi:hypothetical protein SAMN05421821_101578 [Mucilaginibacter lappiensis]|uniref:Uncharacterized protein n=1 Tax=Mucilaginibacter lappiensis TaxID=354630 RepID=A0ABR6PCM8_9SPHI|nr:hypothetical protein [Mucilaginibacter lappiensis]MBB6107500.1 hypothetical protein [Mucilaginibacter lappiensis]SIQ06466.1 hypothetical protein SAMN05421821_101578 [Mucilaginibacter lappiensis]
MPKTVSITAFQNGDMRTLNHVFNYTVRKRQGSGCWCPWLYNEYTNGRLPAAMSFDNDKAADDLSKWLLDQVPAKGN